MNTQRLTISLPNYLYQNLLKITEPRKISRFITSVLEEKIINLKTSQNPIKDFLALRSKLPKKKGDQILKAIKKGRL
jgi:hypothetical protein